MKQREVQDAENVRWVCVQALAGVDGAAADAAEARVEDDGGWEERASDDALLAAIRSP